MIQRFLQPQSVKGSVGGMESPRRECIPDQIFLLFQTANDIFEMAKSLGLADFF